MTTAEYLERPIVESLIGNMCEILQKSELDSGWIIRELSWKDKERLVRKISRDILPSDVIGMYFDKRNLKEEILVFSVDGMFVKRFLKPAEFYSYFLTKELSRRKEDSIIVFINNRGEHQKLHLNPLHYDDVARLFWKLKEEQENWNWMGWDNMRLYGGRCRSGLGPRPFCAKQVSELLEKESTAKNCCCRFLYPEEEQELRKKWTQKDPDGEAELQSMLELNFSKKTEDGHEKEQK